MSEAIFTVGVKLKKILKAKQTRLPAKAVKSTKRRKNVNKNCI